ncbi:MAG: transglutaminase family protein [Bacteroidetes bacterium]|nr:transglutaminase family protein [Bacteroidota bacterium]MCW5894797.1 transglutaminase family protein [Bacteroidota bacterium]
MLTENMNTPDIRQLPALIRLLEDESLREVVIAQLSLFGDSLEDEIGRQGIALNATNALLIRPLLTHYRVWLKEQWGSWQEKKTENERLESALDLIARFQFGRLYPAKLRTLLDNLADEYDARYTRRDALDLAEFLFQGYGLGGVESDDYYNPLNSNLVYVIEQKRGIPISLACVYMLVGDRLGLKIEGCNFPGHFLAVASIRQEKVLVDCYNGGKTISKEALANAKAKLSGFDILRLKCTTGMIVARVLHNLVAEYETTGDVESASIMKELLHSFEAVRA